MQTALTGLLKFTLTPKNLSLWNQRAARIVPLLLFVLVGLELARLTWFLLPAPPPSSQAPTRDLTLVKTDKPPPAAPSLSAVLRSLQQYNPWEAPLEDESSLAELPEPEEQAVATQLDLELVGTLLLPNKASWAILVQRKKRKEQISLQLGNSVDGAILERIERKAVYFRNNGRLEKLSMVDNKTGGAG